MHLDTATRNLAHMPQKVRTTRELSRTVACRKCGAMAGQKCRGVGGAERESSHAERHELAVRCGAKLLDLSARPS
jgi:hypothetical protein